MAKTIGITGTIGSGKTTVGQILLALDVPVIDTDLIVHDLLSQATIKKAAIERFGEGICDATGQLDRRRLGSIVFADPKARKDLESIVHPAVLLEMRRQIKGHTRANIVAVLVPLLFETGIAGEFDEVWTVMADDELLRQRLTRRDGMSEDEITNRLSAQLPQQEKAARSDHVIDNSGSVEESKRQIKLLVSKLSC